MKKLFSHIHILILILGTILIASCDDTLFGSQGGYDGKVGLKLALSLPGGAAATRAGGTGTTTDTEPGTDYENLIERTDIRLLIFQNGEFKEEVAQLKISGNNTNYYLEGVTASEYEGTIETVVFANANNRGVSPDKKAFEGKTTEEVYQMFKFAYGDKGGWTVNEDNRIPMWGSTKLDVIKGQQNNGNVNMYRAIAKVGFTVGGGNGLENFTLQSVRMYFSETQGYCAPMPANIPSDGTTEILTPSVPDLSTQMDVANPLAYTVGGLNLYEDKIYLPEANNKKPGEGRKPVCIVVGGYYNGEGLVDEGANKESFYRIDFKDDLDSGSSDDLRAYDLLRNHSYGIDILSVSNPGTPTPEEALENVVVGLTVEIKEWENVPMRGIPDQYTLTTSTSILSFDNLPANDNLTVTTDYGMDLGDTQNGEWKIVESSGAWFTATKDGDNKTIHITANQNYGVMREGYFYVQSGNLKKKIIITQQQPPTANCYVVGEGTHKLIVTIKGNGDKGLAAEGTTLDTDASIKPASIGIIWETQAGLVRLISAGGSTEGVGGNNKVAYDATTGTIDYVVKVNGANIDGVAGGNALIGAFDDKGTILWSWHIWVRPDLGNNNALASYDENWTLNGYHVMDRNLGALSNKPGVASLGLLYQWGRKDPFIGAAQTNDNFKTTDGKLVTTNYGGNAWAVMRGGETSIENTIKYPTKLTYSGLSETTNIGEKRQYLWGSNGGLNTEGIKDLGSKTIYDPCPYGYRVPPVDAFVFSTNVKLPDNYTVYNEKDFVSYGKRTPNGSDNSKSYTMVVGHTYKNVYVTVKKGWNTILDNEFKDSYTLQQGYTGTYRLVKEWKATNCIIRKSSEDHNWNENLTYVPHFIVSSGWVNADYLQNNYTGNYIEADYYGFYLNYKEIKTPMLTSSTKDGIEHYRSNNNNWTTRRAKYTDELASSNTNTTWLPLSGAYDPTKGFTFNGVTIEKGSSITINSFLWTNSSVMNGGDWIPAAMFLHGTEKWTTATGSGRHIHGMTQSNIKAEPHYASAVRCVRDTKKDFSESNYLEGSVTIGNSVGSTATATLKSINDSWRVIDSGAYWLSVSPEQGGPDKGKGQELTFKALEINNTGGSRTATVLIQFGNEAKPRKIIVTQS